MTEINTVHASHIESNEMMKGGLILAKIRPKDITKGKIRLILSY